MAVARGPWALVVMQITCYTTHIGEKKKKKTKQKHNFWQKKNENKTTKLTLPTLFLCGAWEQNLSKAHKAFLVPKTML